jgi:hypothetical protein
VIRLDFPVRRHLAPRAPQAGIAHALVKAGDMIKVGQPLVRMTDIFGRPLGDQGGLLFSEHDGWVIGQFHGIVRYAQEPILGLAIRDTGSLIVPYPEA